MPNRPNEIPRRICLPEMVPAELAITEAMQKVEAMPADTRLTEAVVLLEKARDKVADYVDDNLASKQST